MNGCNSRTPSPPVPLQKLANFVKPVLQRGGGTAIIAIDPSVFRGVGKGICVAFFKKKSHSFVRSCFVSVRFFFPLSLSWILHFKLLNNFIYFILFCLNANLFEKWLSLCSYRHNSGAYCDLPLIGLSINFSSHLGQDYELGATVPGNLSSRISWRAIWMPAVAYLSSDDG